MKLHSLTKNATTNKDVELWMRRDSLSDADGGREKDILLVADLSFCVTHSVLILSVFKFEIFGTTQSGFSFLVDNN